MPAFTDEVVGVVDFTSSWKQERNCASSSTQTKELRVAESSCQSVHTNEVQVQTEADEKEFQILEEEKDSPELLQFLRKVEPMVTKALIRNAHSTAFDGFKLSSEADEEECTTVHTLTHAELSNGLSVTSLSWNSTGSVLAVSYGRFDHEDWCTHKSSLCTWNLNKTGETSTKPDTVIDVSNCLMSTAFHPLEPALLAAGSFNGEVLVWDLSREADMLIATSVKGDESHNEPISKVIWSPVPGKRRQFNVISVSTDGKMLVWRMSRDKGKLKLDHGYMLLAKSMPKSLKIKTSKKNAEMGVTSVSFSSIDDTTFYTGAESGGMFKCSTNSKSIQLGDGSSDVPIYDPVSFKFLPHKGPVYSVCASPFHRNLFASCSSDTTLRLHSALQTEPLLVLEPAGGYLYSARWSPIRPMVVAVATQTGSLLIYDLRRSRNVPIHTLESSLSKQDLYSLEFNPKQCKLLAAGDAAGMVKVWKLSDDLTVESGAERLQLNQLVDSASTQE